jgi:hypothetical protein
LGLRELLVRPRARSLQAELLALRLPLAEQLALAFPESRHSFDSLLYLFKFPTSMQP